MALNDWIEHRREDGERVGWLRPEGDGFVAIDLLGRELPGEVEWLAGEGILEELGIGYLGEPYDLCEETGVWVRVRLVEVSEDRVLAKTEDWGDVTRPWVIHELPFPPGERLRPHRSSAHGATNPFS